MERTQALTISLHWSVPALPLRCMNQAVTSRAKITAVDWRLQTKRCMQYLLSQTLHRKSWDLYINRLTYLYHIQSEVDFILNVSVLRGAVNYIHFVQHQNKLPFHTIRTDTDRKSTRLPTDAFTYTLLKLDCRNSNIQKRFEIGPNVAVEWLMLKIRVQ
jgi:hypothetical protein